MGKQTLNKRTLELEVDREKDDFKGNFKKGKFDKKRRFKDLKLKGKKTNDPAWHGKNSQIVKDLCSLPFNTMLGFPPTFESGTKYIFGIIRSYFVDWFAGVSQDFRSFLNTAATNLWEFIRSRNSGATNYQSADIFTNVILGCLDCLATAAYLASCFDYVDMYSVYNRLIPKSVFEMRKIDFEDFVSNIANYRGRFNMILAKMSAIVVPDQFPMYKWIMSLYENIYKDRDSETGREQLMVPVKLGYHIFDPTSDPQGGQVRIMMLSDVNVDHTGQDRQFAVTVDSNVLKFEVYLDIWEKQINAIITDEDCNIIFGDLIKAYGSEGKFFKFAPLTEGAHKSPVYSEEFLLQFHNAILAPPPKVFPETTVYKGATIKGYAYDNTIKQDAQGYLLSSFEYVPDLVGDQRVTYGHYLKESNDFLLDCNDIRPEPDTVMTMTRFHNRYKIEDRSGYTYIQASACSAVLVFEGAVRTIVDDAVTDYKINQLCRESFDTRALVLSNFDWSPLIYMLESTGMLTADHLFIFGDINNIQPLKYDTIARIHDVDFASLYDVPFTGKF